MANDNKWKPTVKQALAIGLVTQQDPEKWGKDEHLAMLRYLVLQCSDKAKLTLAEIQKLPADAKLVVSWSELKAEFTDGKLAECANAYKALVDMGEMDAPKKRESVYA